MKPTHDRTPSFRGLAMKDSRILSKLNHAASYDLNDKSQLIPQIQGLFQGAFLLSPEKMLILIHPDAPTIVGLANHPTSKPPPLQLISVSPGPKTAQAYHDLIHVTFGAFDKKNILEILNNQIEPKTTAGFSNVVFDDGQDGLYYSPKSVSDASPAHFLFIQRNPNAEKVTSLSVSGTFLSGLSAHLPEVGLNLPRDVHSVDVSRYGFLERLLNRDILFEDQGQAQRLILSFQPHKNPRIISITRMAEGALETLSIPFNKFELKKNELRVFSQDRESAKETGGIGKKPIFTLKFSENGDRLTDLYSATQGKEPRLFHLPSDGPLGGPADRFREVLHEGPVLSSESQVVVTRQAIHTFIPLFPGVIGWNRESEKGRVFKPFKVHQYFPPQTAKQGEKVQIVLLKSVAPSLGSSRDKLFFDWLTLTYRIEPKQSPILQNIVHKEQVWPHLHQTFSGTSESGSVTIEFFPTFFPAAGGAAQIKVQMDIHETTSRKLLTSQLLFFDQRDMKDPNIFILKRDRRTSQSPPKEVPEKPTFQPEKVTLKFSAFGFFIEEVTLEDGGEQTHVFKHDPKSPIPSTPLALAPEKHVNILPVEGSSDPLPGDVSLFVLKRLYELALLSGLKAKLRQSALQFHSGADRLTLKVVDNDWSVVYEGEKGHFTPLKFYPSFAPISHSREDALEFNLEGPYNTQKMFLMLNIDGDEGVEIQKMVFLNVVTAGIQELVVTGNFRVPWTKETKDLLTKILEKTRREHLDSLNPKGGGQTGQLAKDLRLALLNKTKVGPVGSIGELGIQTQGGHGARRPVATVLQRIVALGIELPGVAAAPPSSDLPIQPDNPLDMESAFIEPSGEKTPPESGVETDPEGKTNPKPNLNPPHSNQGTDLNRMLIFLLKLSQWVTLSPQMNLLPHQRVDILRAIISPEIGWLRYFRHYLPDTFLSANGRNQPGSPNLRDLESVQLRMLDALCRFVTEYSDKFDVSPHRTERYPYIMNFIRRHIQPATEKFIFSQIRSTSPPAEGVKKLESILTAAHQAHFEFSAILSGLYCNVQIPMPPDRGFIPELIRWLLAAKQPNISLFSPSDCLGSPARE
jgi:hypothetical protein